MKLLLSAIVSASAMLASTPSAVIAPDAMQIINRPAQMIDQPPIPSAVVLNGLATWFDAARGPYSSWYTRAGIEHYGAAGPELRAIKQHRWRTSWPVMITSKLTGKSIVVHVVDVCTCYGVRRNPNDDRLIDLAPAVWQALGVPLSRGVMQIELRVMP
jgi:hypothetical protein